MKSFDNGVGWYAHGYYPVSFPEGDICCGWCRFCKVEYLEDRQKRLRCALKNEIIHSNACTSIADFCPLEFEEGKN